MYPQRHLHVCPLHPHSPSQRRRHRERQVWSFVRTSVESVSTFPVISVFHICPAFCSYVSSCVLYISWMPLFTASVNLCSPVCAWYNLIFLSNYSIPVCSLRLLEMICFLCCDPKYHSKQTHQNAVKHLFNGVFSGWFRSGAALRSSHKTLYGPLSTTPAPGERYFSPRVI